jgi:hypothetical protein
LYSLYLKEDKAEQGRTSEDATDPGRESGTHITGWPTVLVDGQIEIDPGKPLPPFAKGGRILIYKKDTFSKENVPTIYEITNVNFDVYSVKQYVYLKEITEEL